MPLVVVASPKGGVGKTTLAANLAIALHRLGRQVVVVDFDSQNAQRFLLLPYGDEGGIGIAGCVARGLPWSAALRDGTGGVRVAPFGASTSAERLLIKQVLIEERLSDSLDALRTADTDIIIADTAPGDGRLQERLEQLADLELLVFLADAGSMSLVPTYREGLLLRPKAEDSARPVFAVLNQVDPRRRLSRDITDFVAQNADRFVGTIHYDEALAEAAACGMPVVEASPNSLASKDINDLAQRLDTLLTKPSH
jgi:cellulose synthase operon protein YhjQ